MELVTTMPAASPEIAHLFGEYLGMTQDISAAATLVFAQVMNEGGTENIDVPADKKIETGLQPCLKASKCHGALKQGH